MTLVLVLTPVFASEFEFAIALAFEFVVTLTFGFGAMFRLKSGLVGYILASESALSINPVVKALRVFKLKSVDGLGKPQSRSVPFT